MLIEQVLTIFKDQFKIISKVQKILLNLNEENFKSSLDLILSLPLFDEKLKFQHFLESIDSAIYARPKMFKVYIDLILNFQTKIKNELTQNELFHIFGSHIVNFHLYIHSFYTTQFIKATCQNDEVISSIFTPFFELIENNNEICCNIDANNFKENCLRGENPNLIAHALRNDDIKLLQYHISHSNLDVNMKIPRSIFEISYILYDEPSLIEYSAFFASLQCFKFLLMQPNIKISDKLSNFAVAGGDYTIIHLIENKNIKFSAEDLNFAVQFHQNEVAEYLRDSYQIIDVNNESLFTSVTYYNICYFIKHINEVQDINIRNKFNSTLLHTAAFYGQYDIVQFLLNIDGIDIDAKTDLNRSPIQIAEEMEENEIANLIKKYKMKKENKDVKT